MRICLLANANHPNTLNWARFLVEHFGHEVHIISFNATRLDSKGIQIHVVRDFLRISKIKYLISHNKVKDIIHKISPDLVIGYRISSYGVLGSFLNFHPFVLAAQGQSIIYPENSVSKKWFVKRAIRKADLINSWAPHMTEKLIELGADPPKIITLPRGVDTRIFFPDGPKDNICRAITTRGLNPRYNQEVVIRAIPTIIKEIGKFEYLIVGDGSERGRLEKIVHDLHLETRVQFKGRMSHSDIPEYLNRCSLYISCVKTDGLSSSLLEAMACGCFPIVPENPSNAQWITDRKNGFLLGDVTPDTVATAIVLAHKDEGLRKSAGIINRGLVETRASWQENMKKIEAAYRALVSKNNQDETRENT